MKVGLVYDPIYLEHDTGAHVENKQRLVAIKEVLEKTGLMNQLTPIPPRAATLEELLMVHSQEHISRVEAFSKRGGGWLDPDTVSSPASYQVALYAAGGLLEAVDAVMGGKVNSAFALVRPPGHHATALRAMGFCLFNNVAIAARYAQRKHGLERILIVDFDVHHGNGTQETFYNDPQVLYFSTHQYPFYPGTGAIDETGHGPGRKATVNVPLPAWCGDDDYLRVYEEILVPVARRFQPQLILVSAGYDPHWADQIAMMQLSVQGFMRIVEIIKGLAAELCNGRVLFTLEGGYNLEAISQGVKGTLELLLGNAWSGDPLGKAPTLRKPPSIEPVLDAVKKTHQLT